MEAAFYKKLKEDREALSSNSVSLSKTKYLNIINNVIKAKTKTKKEPSDYKVLKRYDVLEVDGVKKLIVPLKNNSDILYFVHDEEIFDIIMKIHTSVGHGGRDRTMNLVRSKYRNITYKDIMIFISLCEHCQQKTKPEKIDIEPETSNDTHSKWQLDVVNLNLEPDNEFKFVMVYYDCSTKFCVLRPLKSTKADEISDILVDIFTLIGGPVILQSGNGTELVREIIDCLKIIWPTLKMVCASPIQINVEESHDDIKRMIATWMEENNTNSWSKGLRFVQLLKNRKVNSKDKMSPFKAHFGEAIRIGLCSSNITEEVLQEINEEEDLKKLSEIEEDKPEFIVEESCSSADLKMEVAEKDFNCIVCQEECVEGVNCIVCNGYMHDNCVSSLVETICIVCNKKKVMEMKERAPEPLPERSRKRKHPPIEVGDTVCIPVPQSEREENSARSILAVVIALMPNDHYQLGTKYGILQQLYQRYQFASCSERIFRLQEIPKHKKVSLRTVALVENAENEPTTTCRCNAKCVSARCACKKARMLCNSSCHQFSSCFNM